MNWLGLALYRILTGLALGLALPAWPLVALLRPGWLEGLAERLGASPKPADRPVWIHGASLGEVGLALLLARRLQEAGVPAVVSATTLAGRSLALRDLGAGRAFLAPLDQIFCVRRAFRRLDPRSFVLIETELWPELLREAQRRGVPLRLVNGRISDRAWPRYRRLRPLLAPMLRGFTAVFPRSALDAVRLIELGVPEASCRPPGDLKSASLLLPRAEPAPEPGRVLVTGSLHASEIPAWLDLLRATRAGGWRHVVALRHLDSLGALKEALASERIEQQAWSELKPGWPRPMPEVLVVDTVGELARLYGLGGVAFVGGSLDPKSGGHNLLEPAAAGLAVLFGPGTRNQALAAEALLRSGGGRRVQGVDELAGQLLRLGGSPDELREMRLAALETARAEAGAGRRALEQAVASLKEAS